MSKTKKALKKLLISLLVIITLFNFIGSISPINDVFATSITNKEPSATVEQTTVGGPLSFVGGAISDAIGGLVNGLVGALLNFIKTIIVSPVRMLRDLNFTLASAGGKVPDLEKGEITPYEIFFNKFALLDANIFSTTMSDEAHTPLDKDGVVYKIRMNTSTWYYAIRLIAITAAAIMLLWNLLKSLSKSTSAGQKVIAKNALMDWVLSLALIMFMHIIIILILGLNEQLLGVFEKFTTEGGPTLGAFVDSLESVIFSDNLTLSIAAIAIYAVLEWQTFKYIFFYVQRLLTIVLLVLISPLVPVTYSTDKMKGGRGVALNTWLKELVYNVFVQCVHAFIYCAILGVAFGMFNEESTVKSTGDLGTAFIAIAGLLFVKYAERIVKTVFGFNNSQIINTNIFSDVSSVAIGAGRAVGRGVQRAATGGPLISFGQNVDGSHIGIGQVASGLGNSVKNTAVGIKEGAGNVIAGAGNAYEHVRDFKDQVKQKGSDWLDSVEERGGIVEVGKDKAKDAAGRARDAVVDKASDIKGGAINIFTKLSGKNSGKNKEEQEKRNKLDEAVENIKKEEEEREKARKKEEQSDTENKPQNNDNSDSENKSQNKDVVNNEESEKKETNKTDEENTTETIKTKTTEVEETEEKIINEEIDTDSKNSSGEQIVVGIGRGVDPELLNKFKEELKAIFNNDSDVFKKWNEEIQKKFDLTRAEVSTKQSNEIMQFISKNFNDKGKIFDYINSFKEGSAERNFAETVNEMYTLQDLKDGNKSDEEKVKSLVDLYNSKGLEIPPTMVTKMTSDKDVDRLVIEDQLKDNPKNETRVETEDSKPTDPVLEAITNDSLAGTVKALGSLGLKLNNGVKVEGRAEGSIETEIESKIEEDFESRMTETAAKYNLAEKSQLKDIKEKMSKKAQEELKNYEAKKLFEKDLSDEAKSFAILEREAKYLGFEAEKGKVSVSGRTTIESHFEDGTTHRSVGDTADEAVKGAISNLASRKAEIEKNSNNQNMRRGA